MEKSYSKAQFEYRRADTHRKIQYGGLIVKAGLIDEPKDVILGAQLSIKHDLDHEPGTRELFKSKGMEAFRES